MADDALSDRADLVRRNALRKAASAAKALADELVETQAYYGKMSRLRSDVRETTNRIRKARFSIGALSMELQQALADFGAADQIEAGPATEGETS